MPQSMQQVIVNASQIGNDMQLKRTESYAFFSRVLFSRNLMNALKKKDVEIVRRGLPLLTL